MGRGPIAPELPDCLPIGDAVRSHEEPAVASSPGERGRRRRGAYGGQILDIAERPGVANARRLGWEMLRKASRCPRQFSFHANGATQLRAFQNQGPADFLEEPPGTRPLLRLSHSRSSEFSSRGVVPGKHGVDRGTVPAQLPERPAAGRSRRAWVKQTSDPSPCARSGRRSISFGWQTIRISERPGLARNGGMGTRSRCEYFGVAFWARRVLSPDLRHQQCVGYDRCG